MSIFTRILSKNWKPKKMTTVKLKARGFGTLANSESRGGFCCEAICKKQNISAKPAESALPSPPIIESKKVSRIVNLQLCNFKFTKSYKSYNNLNFYLQLPTKSKNVGK